MNNPAVSDSVNMSCTFLDKLAPETRVLIYGYVLSFETPVKHVKKMQPFLRKLTRGKSASGAESTESEDEYEWEDVDLHSTSVEPGPSKNATGRPEPLRLVNTSVLRASKLIYMEAIAVFYKKNIISVDPHFGDLAALESPQATDLSLAKQIIAKIDIQCDARSDRKISSAMRNAIKIATVGLPAIFPNLLSSRIYVNVDALYILKMAGKIRRSHDCEAVSFLGVANLTASWNSHPYLKFIVQDRATMERWAVQPKDVPRPPRGQVSAFEFSADLMHRAWRADPEGAWARYARQIFDAFRGHFVPEVYRSVGPESHEFWTVVDGSLTLYQKHAPRPS